RPHTSQACRTTTRDRAETEQPINTYENLGRPKNKTLPVLALRGIGSGKWNWTRNKKFIDQALASGKPVRLVTDPNSPQYKRGNVFQRELKYLQGKGYGWRQVGFDENFPVWEVYRVRP
ncbi:hypothetical protein, partial [Streptomyces sp. NPDC046909]|uniref:hypothetical protein n=1 Tax=Streptomyces sp. NPDC046909 TaxID=3155617 RepID=UPI0033E3ECE5